MSESMTERINRKHAPASFDSVELVEWGDFDSPNPADCGYAVVADGTTLYSFSFADVETPLKALDAWLDEYCDDVEPEPDTLEAFIERLLAVKLAD